MAKKNDILGRAHLRSISRTELDQVSGGILGYWIPWLKGWGPRWGDGTGGGDGSGGGGGNGSGGGPKR